MLVVSLPSPLLSYSRHLPKEWYHLLWVSLSTSTNVIKTILTDMFTGPLVLDIFFLKLSFQMILDSVKMTIKTITEGISPIVLLGKEKIKCQVPEMMSRLVELIILYYIQNSYYHFYFRFINVCRYGLSIKIWSFMFSNHYEIHDSKVEH